MGHAPVRPGLIFDGWFQFYADTMAFITKIGFVTHGTYALPLLGNTSMVVRKIGCVHIALVRERFIFGVMTVQTKLHGDAFFLFMNQWWHPYSTAKPGANPDPNPSSTAEPDSNTGHDSK
jgi:hypothetical protein